MVGAAPTIRGRQGNAGLIGRHSTPCVRGSELTSEHAKLITRVINLPKQ